MKSLRAGVVLLACLLAAACGGNASPAASQSPPPDTSVTIKTATVTVDGKSQTVLTDSQGATLYWTSIDYANKVNCTGDCATIWPPVLATLGDPKPAKGVTLSGQLKTILGGNGRQVEYNGHPLYRYSKDSTAGQATGQGVNGKWSVATPDVSTASPSPSPS